MSDDEHFVTVIETKDPELYNGLRVTVFHNRMDAESDMLFWINEIFFGGVLPAGDVETAMDRYRKAMGTICEIKEDC